LIIICATGFEGPVTGNGDKWLRVGPVKLFADGATAETVAFSLKIGGRTIDSGSYRDDFEEMLFAATEKGFRVCVHSFGNATTDAVLTAFENAAMWAPAGFEIRPRLEHVTLISTSQIKRLAAMGGCACIQPQFLSRAQNTKQVILDEGKWYAYGDLVKGGIIVASSSDDPGGFMDARDPIKGSVMGSAIAMEQVILSFQIRYFLLSSGSGCTLQAALMSVGRRKSVVC